MPITCAGRWPRSGKSWTRWACARGRRRRKPSACLGSTSLGLIFQACAHDIEKGADDAAVLPLGQYGDMRVGVDFGVAHRKLTQRRIGHELGLRHIADAEPANDRAAD